MLSNHYTVTVPQDESYVYQNLVLNETSKDYNLPRTVIFSNTEDHDMIINLMTKAEGDGAESTGVFLKAQSQLQFKDIGLTYRVGVKFVTSQTAAGECVISCFHYNHVDV